MASSIADFSFWQSWVKRGVLEVRTSGTKQSRGGKDAVRMTWFRWELVLARFPPILRISFRTCHFGFLFCFDWQNSFRFWQSFPSLATRNPFGKRRSRRDWWEGQSPFQEEDGTMTGNGIESDFVLPDSLFISDYSTLPAFYPHFDANCRFFCTISMSPDSSAPFCSPNAP